MESERLEALWSYDVLDSPSEPCFDDVAEIAAKACGTPFALVSFVDRKRQWFKARIGLTGFQEMPREHAFCHYCIQNDGEILEIPDPQEDDLFSDNPLVHGDPWIRFYAGAPIRVREGHLVGTVCVLDQRPRSLSAEQKRILEILADRMADFLEMRRSKLEAKEDRDQEISRRVLASEIEERKRIGQELHDGVTQTLGAAHMHMDLARKSTDPQERERAFDDLGRLLEEARSEVRGVGHSLMGKKIREKGLQGALKDLIQDYDSIGDAPRIDLNFSLKRVKLGEVEAVNLYRIAQEFVQNSMKHARADRIRILLYVSDHTLWMRFEDDGEGVHPERIRKTSGLENMEHRVRFLGGNSSFDGRPGKGVRFTVCLDLDRCGG